MLAIIVECGCSKIVTTLYKREEEAEYSEIYRVGLCNHCGKKDKKGYCGDYSKSPSWKVPVQKTVEKQQKKGKR